MGIKRTGCRQVEDPFARNRRQYLFYTAQKLSGFQFVLLNVVGLDVSRFFVFGARLSQTLFLQPWRNRLTSQACIPELRGNAH